MYDGDNLTAIKSMNWFAESLVKLMSEMPYKDIAVRMLCLEADLARQTFYNLFNNKDEVLLYYLQRTAMERFDGIEPKNQADIRLFVEAFAGYIEDNNKLMILISENHLQSLLQTAISNDISVVAKRFASTQGDKYGTAFLSGGLTQIIICWIYDKNRISINALVEIIEKIMMGTYYKVGE